MTTKKENNKSSESAVKIIFLIELNEQSLIHFYIKLIKICSIRSLII